MGTNGYIMVYAPGHPSANNGYIPEHILVAEIEISGRIPIGAIVHHKDENKQNNQPDNLFICSCREEHNQIHAKLKAFHSCGNENYKPCIFCGGYDNPDVMILRRRIKYSDQFYHQTSRSKYRHHRRLLGKGF